MFIRVPVPIRYSSKKRHINRKERRLYGRLRFYERHVGAPQTHGGVGFSNESSPLYLALHWQLDRIESSHYHRTMRRMSHLMNKDAHSFSSRS